MNGTPVPRTHQLLSATVVTVANQVASARLAWQDGAASEGNFALSSGSLFIPGAEVEVVAAADGGRTDLLFKGLVVAQRLRVRQGSPPQLVVECRHAAVKLTVQRRGAVYCDMTDGDVIRRLLGGAGLRSTVADAPVRHAHLVQNDATDWDLLVTRAQANGQVVLTRGEEIETRAPALAGSPAATLEFGATLLELDAEVDAREQARAVRTLTWSAADQEVHTREANPPSLTGPGNLAPDDLAAAVGAEAWELRHASLPDAEATAAAEARFARARLDKASGRALCFGLGQLQPGDTVALAGVGDRFNGRVFVTGVRHEVDQIEGWRTHVQFGGVPEDPARRERLEARRATSLLAPVHGLQVGVVTDNEDPEGEFRVRVRLPLVDPSGDGVWARVASADAGNDRGVLLRPEVGDEVVVGFFDDDPRAAVLLGMLHSSARPAPLTPSNENHEKAFVTRSGVRLHVDDEKAVLTVSTPAGHRLVFDDDKKSVVLEDANGNRLTLDEKGVTVESCDALTLKASGDATLDLGKVELNASGELKLQGGSGAELSASGTVKVKGALVQIN